MVVTKKTFQAGIEINHQRKNLESRKKETAKKRRKKRNCKPVGKVSMFKLQGKDN